MPEGDTLYRIAKTLDRALTGRAVTEFRTELAQLARTDAEAPIVGRTVEGVRAVGKHLLIVFSGGLTLRSHLRMNGNWHVYRPGERWMRKGEEMRVVVGNGEWLAVGFSLPVAEFVRTEELGRDRELARLGPDLLSEGFDVDEAVARIASRPDEEVADALLDQRLVAGIGNVYKSEVLFLARVSPFAKVGELERERLRRIIELGREALRANVSGADRGRRSFSRVMRRTTRRMQPQAALWVYGRAGKACRECGSAIAGRRQGRDARPTFWCPSCQG